MGDEYRIQLNFLPFERELPELTLSRRPRELRGEVRPDGEVVAHKLPVGGGSQEWKSYWVSVDDREGFERFTIGPYENRDVTNWCLFLGIRDVVVALVPEDEYVVPKKVFGRELFLLMRNHSEGDETLVVHPYFLRAIGRFGLLVDFHFRLEEGVPYDRRVQQLSLSLDENGRRNLDYYRDRHGKIQSFVDSRRNVLESIRLPGTDAPLQLSRNFVALDAAQLRPRDYVFANGREHKSQFGGLRAFGPLAPSASPIRLLFVFREEERAAARTLALALRGTSGGGSFGFPGFQALFKTDLEVDREPVVVREFSTDELAPALRRAEQAASLGSLIIPVVVLPSGDQEDYLRQKAVFIHSGVPTQVCTLRVLQDPDTMKWAIGNLALQLFCKAGGQPWKVRPTSGERTLIAGIAQSHKVREDHGEFVVERYFAFSVLTDSSGLFQQIRVLSEADQEEDYLAALRRSLTEVLAENAAEFRRLVIHTSFALRRSEMLAIRDAVSEAASGTSGCRFAVVKVNHRTRFFGVNRAINSLVPYEATLLQLGRDEFLVWFEGLLPGNRTVSKAFPGPTHLQFLDVGKESAIPPGELLQDLVNLSGANWRGFNAKSAPVSVYYCHLVADLVREFHQRNLPLPTVKDLRPWFL
jgi:hypothetical protein